jgi:hypothetical protein
MDGLIILGLLPGTNIQITFAGWLILAECTAAFFMYKQMVRRQLFLKLRLTLEFYAMPHRQMTALWTRRIV